MLIPSVFKHTYIPGHMHTHTSLDGVKKIFILKYTITESHYDIWANR